jgi:hypothetical protein
MWYAGFPSVLLGTTCTRSAKQHARKINKTVIVASSWCSIFTYLHWWCTVKHKSNIDFLDRNKFGKLVRLLVLLIRNLLRCNVTRTWTIIKCIRLIPFWCVKESSKQITGWDKTLPRVIKNCKLIRGKRGNVRTMQELQICSRNDWSVIFMFVPCINSIKTLFIVPQWCTQS